MKAAERRNSYFTETTLHVLPALCLDVQAQCNGLCCMLYHLQDVHYGLPLPNNKFSKDSFGCKQKIGMKRPQYKLLQHTTNLSLLLSMHMYYICLVQGGLNALISSCHHHGQGAQCCTWHTIPVADHL